MSEQDEQVTVVQDSGGGNAGKWILLLLGVIYVAASLYLLMDMRGQLSRLNREQMASEALAGPPWVVV